MQSIWRHDHGFLEWRSSRKREQASFWSFGAAVAVLEWLSRLSTSLSNMCIRLWIWICLASFHSSCRYLGPPLLAHAKPRWHLRSAARLFIRPCLHKIFDELKPICSFCILTCLVSHLLDVLMAREPVCKNYWTKTQIDTLMCVFFFLKNNNLSSSQFAFHVVEIYKSHVLIVSQVSDVKKLHTLLQSPE